MSRDYSSFLPQAETRRGPDPHMSALAALGWKPFFAQQTSVDDLAEMPPARIIEVRRNALHVLGDGIDTFIPPRSDATVGDWVLLDRAQPQASRLLDRKSLIKRRAPGTDRQVQLIAANIDTAFIVSSCNQDFKLARLERYIALALEADITPVVVLTKVDLTRDAQSYVDKAASISHLASVVTLDARGEEPGEKLAEWCKPGHTVAFLGSSGVGKSTLTNALSGTQAIATQAIREDDAKGRHTTTRRQLHQVLGGCLVLDTPGMRELQLTEAESGIEDVFADIVGLARQCRFNDCRHESEPGCAVQEAIEAGDLDPMRLARWRKLSAEDAFNSASLAERRSKDKAFGKMVRRITKDHDKRRRPRG
ncbi:MAG: ribosome small subunit-dependent GTPase A [Hyphomicrobiales bacterium]|jgi:ribosome biogenesis GTPase